VGLHGRAVGEERVDLAREPGKRPLDAPEGPELGDAARAIDLDTRQRLGRLLPSSDIVDLVQQRARTGPHQEPPPCGLH
jgi:hypothetical protein